MLTPSHRHPRRTVGALVNQVTKRLTEKYSALLPASLLHRALQDAVELARESEFPLLFLPELAEEKVRIVSKFVAARGARPPCDAYVSAA